MYDIFSKEVLSYGRIIMAISREKSMLTLPERMAAAYTAMEELRVAAQAIDSTAEEGTYIVRPPKGKRLTAVEQRVGGGHSESWGKQSITAENGFEATGARLLIDGIYPYGEYSHKTEAGVIFTRPGEGNERYASEWELKVPANQVVDLTVERVQ
jgi:hypothetical protein